MTELQELDDSTRLAAEEVRAHLVTLRGRALFLSPLDGRLLLEWLEAGVTVPFILKTLEEAAEKRRAKRLKSPLKLSSIKGRVSKVIGTVGTPPEAWLEELPPIHGRYGVGHVGDWYGIGKQSYADF